MPTQQGNKHHKPHADRPIQIAGVVGLYREWVAMSIEGVEDIIESLQLGAQSWQKLGRADLAVEFEYLSAALKLVVRRAYEAGVPE